MVNWPDVALASTIAGIASATVIKIFGNGKKCYVRHDEIYRAISERVKERQMECAKHQAVLKELEHSLAASVREVAVHENQIKTIMEALHDIKRSQQDIIHILTRRAERPAEPDA